MNFRLLGLSLGYLINAQSQICAKSDDRVSFPVIYSPYVAQLQKDKQEYRAKNSYNETDIRNQIQILSKTFSTIITLGMGTTYGLLQNSEALIALSAAKHNSIAKTGNALKVVQGILVDRFLDRELESAINSTEKANKIYPGTVIGYSFNIEDLNSANVKLMPKRISKLKTRILNRNQSLLLSVRLFQSDCLLIQSNTYIQQVLRFLDTIICLHLPSVPLMKNPEEFAQTLFEFRSEIQNQIGDKPPVMVETGWPSLAVKHGDRNKLSAGALEHLKNFVQFWSVIKSLRKNSSFVIMREAFDQPNLCQIANEPGAECSYGYWFTDVEQEETKFIAKFDLLNMHQIKKENAMGYLSIILSIGFALLFTAVFFGLYYFRTTRHRNDVISKDEYFRFLKGLEKNVELGCFNEEFLASYNTKLELPKDSFVIDTHRILGIGAFGTVFEGKIEGVASRVAFKTMKVGNSVTMKAILSEIKIMSYIGLHPHLVHLVGAYTAEAVKGIAYLAMEVCEIGSLQNYLRKSSNKFQNAGETKQAICERYAEDPTLFPRETTADQHNRKKRIISETQMFKWALEISEAMVYLCKKKVIHGDLATRNVLLTSELTVKVTDFGLSRRLYGSPEYVKTSKDPMPWRWMAIESLKQMIFTSKSDVWSYGITIWEIFSLGDVPYGGLGWKSDFTNMLCDGLRPNRPTNCSNETYNLMNKCWSLDPDNRPVFEEIGKWLEAS